MWGTAGSCAVFTARWSDVIRVHVPHTERARDCRLMEVEVFRLFCTARFPQKTKYKLLAKFKIDFVRLPTRFCLYRADDAIQQQGTRRKLHGGFPFIFILFFRSQPSETFATGVMFVFPPPGVTRTCWYSTFNSQGSI